LLGSFLVKQIKNFDEIFKLLKKELQHYTAPVEKRKTWDEIINTPFTTLISCIISLRTKDEVTDKASIRLLKEYNTPEKIINLSNKEIEKLIYPAGFYKTKAKTIKEISKTLIEKYDGKVPDDFNELLKLRGVGRKTAAIVMLYGHKNPNFIPVDIHVHIISNRLGWVKSRKPDETMDKLMKVIPKKYWREINHLFVKFGQTICLTISPRCSICPVENFCPKLGVVRSR
jgi:endonuclease-3